MVHNKERKDNLPVVEIERRSITANIPAPGIIKKAGTKATRRFFEFFTANIRNANTRKAYARAIADFFFWAESCGLRLIDIEPIVVAAYVEHLAGIYAPPTAKQHLAAIRMCFDWLVTGQVLPLNPAAAVRGPTHVVKRGKTPVLSAEEARQLLDSIDTSTVVGLRDRAIIGSMVYSFARVSAIIGMRVEDYYQFGKRSWLRLHEKGGKFHEIPAHHKAEAYLDSYITAAVITEDAKSPLFRTAYGRTGTLSTRGMTRHDVLRMIKRRARAAGLSERVCCHTFRATGITAYLDNGGTIENAQAIAAHESPRTTKLYDRTGDDITLDEIERILI
jgi:site-specific recombinase XerD